MMEEKYILPITTEATVRIYNPLNDDDSDYQNIDIDVPIPNFTENHVYMSTEWGDVKFITFDNGEEYVTIKISVYNSTNGGDVILECDKQYDVNYSIISTDVLPQEETDNGR